MWLSWVQVRLQTIHSAQDLPQSVSTSQTGSFVAAAPGKPPQAPGIERVSAGGPVPAGPVLTSSPMRLVEPLLPDIEAAGPSSVGAAHGPLHRKLVRNRAGASCDGLACINVHGRGSVFVNTRWHDMHACAQTCTCRWCVGACVAECIDNMLLDPDSHCDGWICSSLAGRFSCAARSSCTVQTDGSFD